MRPLLEKYFARQLDDWERYIKREGVTHGENELDFERVEYCEEALRNYAVGTDRGRRASLYGLAHLMVINTRENRALDLRHKRPLLERHFAKHLDEIEENIRINDRSYREFLASGSTAAIDLVRYHVHRIRRFPREDETLGCSTGSKDEIRDLDIYCRRHQIRAAIFFLMYDACVIHEGAK